MHLKKQMVLLSAMELDRVHYKHLLQIIDAFYT